MHKFPYDWRISDGYPAKGVSKSNYKAFGTFICGGGATMGYKLAGFEHLGGVEIDEKMANIYRKNHNPKYLYHMDIRDFNKLQNLPPDLLDLDLLDGSPPCSTFSTAGSREDAWGKEKQFREGQAKQVLDDLVFVYCETILKLRPKVFLLENVTGIIKGNAKSYAKRIVEKMQANGYKVQVFSLDASTMGVPQKRERVFFIGYDSNRYSLPALKLQFSEPPIPFSAIRDYEDNSEKDVKGVIYNLWLQRKTGDENIADISKRVRNQANNFSSHLIYDKKVPNTLLSCDNNILFDLYRGFNDKERKKCGTFPQDYDFLGHTTEYVIGMSVPPVMTAQISYQIRVQWLDKITQTAKP